MINKNTQEYINDNNKFFGRWAWFYDFEKYFFSPLRVKAAEFLDLKTSHKILDVATGTGAQAFALAKLGHEVTGIDVSPEMLMQARKKLNYGLKLKFMETDGTKLPFGDEMFDVSTISWGIHDMPYETGLRVLKEMKRVIKKDGRILIVDYMNPNKHKVAKFIHPLICLYETKYYKPFVERGWGIYLKNTGLKIVKETDYLGIWDFMVLKK